MKKMIFLVLLLRLEAIMYAQDFPDFGVPSKEEWDMTECSFDKEAAAVVLMHEAFSYSEDNLHLITSHHVRIKILKQSGTHAANITIPFIRAYNFERILELQALTLNINSKGEVEKQKVTKKSVYTHAVNELTGEVSFAFPSVTAGSIVEYQYKSIQGNYYGLQDWYFQREIPVLTSRYHLKMIPSKSFSYRVIQNPETETTILPGTDNFFVEMRKIPALSAEPYMDCRGDYLQRVNFKVNGYDSRWGKGQVGTLSTSWPLLNIRLLLDSHFGPMIVAPVPAAAAFTDSMKKETDQYKRMQMIYRYVRDHMKWNKLNNIYANNPAGIWEKQTGDNGDINMLLVNLLNRSQLKAFPLLVSKRFNGRVDTSYSYSDQFNALFACVIINNRKYILDATDTNNAGNLIPMSVLNTRAFLIDNMNGELLAAAEDSIAYDENIRLTLEPGENGQMKGTAVISNAGYARLEKMKLIRNDSVRLKDRYAEQTKQVAVSIADYDIYGNDADSSVLIEKFAFTIPLTGTSGYSFIPLNLFTSLNTNPFLAEKRYSDINFGYKQSITVQGVIKLNNQYAIDALPENTELKLEEAGITFIRKGKINKETNSCEFEIKMTRSKSAFEAKDYTALRNAFRSLLNAWNGQAVLKSNLP